MKIRFYCDIPRRYSARDAEKFGLHARTIPLTRRMDSIRIAFTVDIPRGILGDADLDIKSTGAEIDENET